MQVRAAHFYRSSCKFPEREIVHFIFQVIVWGNYFIVALKSNAISETLMTAALTCVYVRYVFIVSVVRLRMLQAGHTK